MRGAINLKRSERETDKEDSLGGRVFSTKYILIGFVVLVVVFGYFYIKDRNTWRAVFLTNDQAYFGKFVWVPFKSTVTLKEAHFLRQTERSIEGEDIVATDFEIIPLEGQVHGPKNRMVIRKEHILFIEDLNEDGAVVKAINLSK